MLCPQARPQTETERETALRTRGEGRRWQETMSLVTSACHTAVTQAVTRTDFPGLRFLPREMSGLTKCNSDPGEQSQ